MDVRDCIAEVGDLRRGSHVCWLVDDPAIYTDVAAALLSDGSRLGQKPVVFGPADSPNLAELEPAAAIAADPHVAFLDSGPLDPDAMFAMFRAQSALAEAAGYDGLRVVADMDWLLPGRPTVEAIVGFELLLDRVVGELNATVVCAYRRTSFDTAAIAGALAVHPLQFGSSEQPQFRLVAGGADSWRLAGEVDLAVGAAFAAALVAALSLGDCEVDVADLEFLDVAGMRAVAEAARVARVGVRLRGASPMLQRSWRLARFDEVAPMVQLVA
jgi:ABC-type transporter Mla MlaB component